MCITLQSCRFVLQHLASCVQTVAEVGRVMTRRRSSAVDGVATAVKQTKGRCSVSGDNSQQAPAQHKDDSVHSDVGKFDDCELVECVLRENGAPNQSPVSLSKEAASGTCPSPQSLKRRHKPNSMYANDFVITSAKKSKLQKFESEPGSKKDELKKTLLEREETGFRRSSQKADRVVNSAEKEKQETKLPSASDLTSSKSDVKKQGRKPKHINDSSLTDASGNLLSKLNLSPRGAHPKLGRKASVGRVEKHHLANTSLPDEQLSAGIDCLSDRTEVSSTVPRKRGRPPKNPAGEISPITGKRDVKRGDESTVEQTRKSKLSSISAEGKNLNSGSDFYSEYSKLPLSAARERRGRKKKSFVENICNSAEAAERYESSLADDGNMNSENVSFGPNISRRDINVRLEENAIGERGRTSDLANITLSDECLGMDAESSVINKLPLTVSKRHRRPPKKLAETREHCADTKGLVNINNFIVVVLIIQVLATFLNVVC